MDETAAPRLVVQAGSDCEAEAVVVGVAFAGGGKGKGRAEQQHARSPQAEFKYGCGVRRLVRRLGNSGKWLVDQCICSCLVRDKLRGIVSELFADDNPETQLQGAKSLLKLSNADEDQEDKIDRVRIAEYPQALAGLVRILTLKTENPYLQRHAALTLYILALVQENALRIAKFPGALAALAKLLFVDAGSREREESVKLQADALSALAVIAVVPEAGRMIMETRDALRGLIGLLADYERPDVVDEVCKTFSRLSDGQQNAEMLAASSQFPAALEGLVNLIGVSRSRQNHELLKSAILSLYNLSATEEIQVKIANFPKVLDELVMCLWSDFDNLLVEHAASTVGKLTMPQEKRALMNCPEVLPALVDILFKDSNPDAQEEAVWALANLSHDEQANRKIAELPGAVAGLVRLLAKADSPSRQEQAARALANLTCLPENDRYILLPDGTSTDVLTSIVALLTRHKGGHSGMQMWALKGLQNLAATFHQDAWTARAAACAALLAQLLAGPAASEVLEAAARGLGNLAIPRANKLPVAECEPALGALLELLHRAELPGAQREAAWALKNLFREGDEGDGAPTVAALKGPRAVPFLMVLLADDVEAAVLEEATAALAYLARHSGNRADIVEFPGALKRLVAVLAKADNPATQAEALKILRQLTRTPEYRARVADFPDLLVRVMGFLCKSGSPKLVDLQRGATAVLCNLALEPDLAQRIVQFPDAVDGIGDLLYHYDDLQALESAARFFQNVASAPDVALHPLRLAEFPRVLAGLELLLCADDAPVLTQSLLALLNLTFAEANQRTVSASKAALLHLNRLLTKDETPDAQLLAAMVLQNLSAAESNVPNILAQCYYVFEGLLGLLAGGAGGALVQEVALSTLANLAKLPEYQLKIAEFSNAFESVGKLCASENEVVVEQAANLLGSLASAEENRLLMIEVPEIVRGLEWLLSGRDSGAPGSAEAQAAREKQRVAAAVADLERLGAGSLRAEAIEQMLRVPSGNAEMNAIKALAYIDPARAVEVALHSGEAFATRGIVLLEMEMFEDAVADLEDAMCLLPGQYDADFTSMCRWAKWKLQDYEGAIAEADRAVDLNPQAAWQWQERGVLKRHAGDLEGALVDLNRALELEADDYEVLKQRGYVKFLMEDDDGAREDAERATRIRATTVVHVPEEGELVPCLGILPVEYLDYKL